MPKILHCADTHLHASTAENVEHAMAQTLALAREESPDLIIHAGDLAQSATTLTPDISEKLRAWFAALAFYAPVIVVAGNHDIAKGGGAGVLRGVLSLVESRHPIHLFDQPGVWLPTNGNLGVPPAGGWDAEELAAWYAFDTGKLPPIACLPYPNRALLAATRPDIPASEINARASEALEDIVRGLAAQMPGPGLLVFHGSISGATTGTERRIESDVDMVLRESAIPDVFQAVLCGHIHKPQVVGTRCVYPGSPCPLDHGEENHPHGAVIWQTAPVDRHGPETGTWSHRFVEFEPKHRLLTVNARREAFPEGLTTRTLDALEPIDVRGARVRVLSHLARGGSAEAHVELLTDLFMEEGAHEVRVTIEREAEDRAGDSSFVSASADLSELVDAYCARNPDAASYREDLHALAREIEAELPPEARVLQHLGDYRLVAIEGENWKCFGAIDRLELESLGRKTCIQGRMGNGKSALIEVEGFAFWGREPRGRQPLSEYVRIGADEMRVCAEFVAQGQLYRVRRSVKLNGKGEGAGTLLLETADIQSPTFLPDYDGGPKMAVGSWLPASNGNSRETQAQIERLVGSWETFLATRFAAQGDIDRLLNFTPGELKDALQAVLALGAYEHREALARARASATDKRAEMLAAEVSVLDKRAEGLEAARQAVAEAEAVKQERTGQVEQARAQIGASEAKLVTLRRDVAEAEALEQRRAASRSRLAAIEARGNELAKDRAAADEAVLAGDTAQEAIDLHAQAVADLAAMQAQADGRTALLAAEQGAAAAYANDLSTRARAQMQLGRERDQAQKDIAENAVRLKSARTTWAQRIEAERKVAGMIGTTPFGEQCAERACRLLALPIAARGRIPELQESELLECSGLESRGVDLEERLAMLERELRDLKASDEQTIRVLRQAHTEAKAALAAYTFDQAAYDELRGLVEYFSLAGEQAIVEASHAARGRIQAIDAEQASLTREAGEIAGELEDGQPADALEQARAALDAEEFVLSGLRGHFDNEQAALADAIGDLAHESANYDGVWRDCVAADAKRTELAAAQHAANVARIYARAMGKDGVPFLILERALGALEQHANYFLGDDELRVEIEPMRDMRDGSQKSEVVVRYRDSLGLHGLVAASGGQRVKLGIALRFAVAAVQAEAMGFRPSHVYWDEGFGSMDAESRMAARPMVDRVAEWGGRVVYVSHDEEIQEIADSTVHVEIVAGTSTLRRSE